MRKAKRSPPLASFTVKKVSDFVETKRTNWQMNLRQVLATFAALAVVLQIITPITVNANSLTKNFDQCANKNSTLGDCNWIGSIVQQSNSKYYEGMSVPQRILFTDIKSTSGNVHTLTFSHQATKGITHAYDFLTSWNQAVAAAAAINPGLLVNLNACNDLGGLSGICTTLRSGGNISDPSVPDAMGSVIGDNVAARVAAYEGLFGNRTIKIYGNSPITASSLSFNGYNGTNNDADYTLTWTSASTQILVEMAGHLAVGRDGTGIGYGSGKGSSSISGGPYHFKLDKLDNGSLGSQDNQIKGANVIVAPPPPAGSITLDKVTSPAGNPTSFSFTTTHLPSPTNPSLTDAATPITWTGLSAGTYTITESASSEWDLASSNCTGGTLSEVTQITNGISITLAKDESLVCTFSNTKRGKIVVSKNTVPANDTTSFDFTATYSQTDFNLSNGRSNDSGWIAPNSSYTVTEALNPNYATTIICDDRQDPITGNLATISLQPGRIVFCAFTNTIKQTGLTVVKQTNPSQGVSQAFEFTRSWDEQNNFIITTANGTGSETFSLDPGSYSVSEVNLPLGWDKTSEVCVDNNTQQEMNPSSITLSPDGGVTCTFVNTQRGHLIVQKTTNPSGVQTVFTINASGTGTITDGGAGTVTDALDKDYEVTPGTYSVTESFLSGWTETGNTCKDVAVGAGETQSCAITNTKKGHIIVDKVTDPLKSSQSFHFSTTGSGYNPFDLTDTGTPNNQELKAGTYTIAENDQLTNWSLQNVQCIPDGQSTVSPSTNGKEIVLSAGDTVTCTFNNKFTQPAEPQADLGVLKTVDKSAPAPSEIVIYTLTINNAGPDAATGVLATDTLPSTVTFVSASSTQGTYDSATGLWTVGNMANGGSAKLVITATVNSGTAGQSILNETKVSANEFDPNLSNNTSNATSTVPSPSGGCTSNCGGGGGGGGGFSSGGGTAAFIPSNAPGGAPAGQVLGISTPAPAPEPQVLGAATELPRTGASPLAMVLFVLAALAVLDKKRKMT